MTLNLRIALLLGVAPLLLPACAQRPAAARKAANPGVVEISAAEMKRFEKVVAISDVHGEFGPARALLAGAKLIDAEGNWTGGRTILVITGDSIDKGPQSLEVLALWMKLEAQAPKSGGRVLALLGNHEAELLADPLGDTKADATRAELPAGASISALADPAASGSEKVVAGTPLKGYADFLRRLPAAARIGDWLFCHAGWVPPPGAGDAASRWRGLVSRERAALNSGGYGPFLQADGAELLERKEFPEGVKWTRNPDAARELERRLDGYGLKGAVFGHVPAAFGITDGAGWFSASDRRLIKIDSGMAPEAGGFAGHLLILPEPRGLSDQIGTLHALSGTLSGGRFTAGPLAVGKG